MYLLAGLFLWPGDYKLHSSVKNFYEKGGDRASLSM